MQYRRVRIASVAHVLPQEVVTSDEIEARLLPLYERLGLPAGRLELMSGIGERRFFPPGTKPGGISGQTARLAIEQSGIDPALIGMLIHGSVCRDQMEPATACGVHHAAGLPAAASAIDVSNACLGLLNGMLVAADRIELGHIDAAVVVGTETGRGLVEGTIDSLNRDESVTRADVKQAFASLTIGSGSAAIVLCRDDLKADASRLLGGVMRADTSHHQLCAGDVAATTHGDDRPRMATDSEALLHAGVGLAKETWADFTREFSWTRGDIRKVITHQVGRAHRKLLLEGIGLEQEKDFPTVQFLGNTGAVALPTAWSLAIEKGHIAKGDTVALLGIGSGLSCVMLGIES
ncbi:3-oxoacyl-ACP synthase III [Stratiformator vulcanicus]|uniref:3-oxoacyl-[acyl-carrier-protein] synthase 3 n=1 Tax=Stratiformator vulcanicus TaxID=2527980 RepID=A0A517QXG1_9PLAN|nr:3-oxoacyl-ACP synthase III [Stratiformator vulcanicus]QDT36339.1 3-oxoacyl-[acyl-carrier-protein] synthase 3 [Stratiformator vulcanicus]